MKGTTKKEVKKTELTEEQLEIKNKKSFDIMIKMLKEKKALLEHSIVDTKK